MASKGPVEKPIILSFCETLFVEYSEFEKYLATLDQNMISRKFITDNCSQPTLMGIFPIALISAATQDEPSPSY